MIVESATLRRAALTPPAPSPNSGRGGARAVEWVAPITDHSYPKRPLSQNWERGPGGEGRAPHIRRLS